MEIHNKNILCKLFLPDLTKDHEKLKKYLYRGWSLEKYEEFVTWSTDLFIKTSLETKQWDFGHLLLKYSNGFYIWILIFEEPKITP